MPPRTLILSHSRESAMRTLADEIRERTDLDPEVARTPEESREMVPDVEIVLGYDLSEELLERADSLAWMQALSAGVDHYDLAALETRDIALTNASGVHAEPIAEQVLGYLLAFERRFPRAFDQQERGVWEGFSAGELKGKEVCVVGLGEIGTRVAELCSALGCRVTGTKRHPDSAPDAADEVRPPSELQRLLADADHVVIACPLTEETRGLFDGEAFTAMRSSATLTNIARGGIVEQDELVHALQERDIRGAALDVFEEEPLPEESPLWDLSNTILTPHMAGSTPEYWSRLAELFAESYRAYPDGELRNRIV